MKVPQRIRAWPGCPMVQWDCSTKQAQRVHTKPSTWRASQLAGLTAERPETRTVAGVLRSAVQNGGAVELSLLPRSPILVAASLLNDTQLVGRLVPAIL